jgi:methionyl-tRNA synthetase
MSDRPRYYLTTAIAYANSKPGVHTLYEVIGADVIARWHRMKGDDTRFLTGTDEHSINIAQSAVDEGRPAREFVDEKVELFKIAEDALALSPDRFIRTSDPDHVRAAQEMVRRAYANGDIYMGTYEGWYCPNEGFRNATDVIETARGTICPNHPDVPLQWLTERNWFFRLSAYQERLERHFADHPDFVQPEFRRNEMLGFIRGGLEDFSISRERTPGDWGIPFPIAEKRRDLATRGRLVGPRSRQDLRLVRRADQLHHGAGFPDDLASFARWWPADLHVIGKDIARFHTIFWPAMLWSAGLEAPRRVWVHGWLMAAGGERMSKSRGNFLDPNDFVGAFGTDGARYVVLREVPFDRDAEVSWDSFVRRYNADLANDFGNLLNRTVSMTKRYVDGVRPAPRLERDPSLAELWNETVQAYVEAIEGCELHDGLAALWTFVGAANRVVDAEKPWELAKAWKGGDEASGDRLRGVLGDLIEACRLVGLAVAPFMPGAAPRVLGQLGFSYGYGRTGMVRPRSSASSNGVPVRTKRVASGTRSRSFRGWRSRRRRRPRRSGEPLHPRRDAPRRFPLSRQRRSVRRRRRGRAGSGPRGRRREDPRSWLERRLVRTRA